jgi:5-methyltetrahydrofolate--homocysteine methyltransferase
VLWQPGLFLSCPPSPNPRRLPRRGIRTTIQRHHLTSDDFGGKSLEGCNDHLVLTRPDVIRSIHESFLAVGCDVVETCTFQSTPRRLAEWGIGEKIHDINVAAARLARAACDAYSTPEQPRFVA